MAVKHIVCLSLVALLAVASFGAVRQKDGQKDAKIRALMQEREQTLTKLVDSARKLYDLGNATRDFVLNAEAALLDAQLESAMTSRERLAIRQSQLKLAKTRETEIAKLVDLSDVAPTELLKARADRLRAEIDLLKEEKKL